MKMDIFTQVMLLRYKEAAYKYADKFATEKAVQDKRPILTDYEGVWVSSNLMRKTEVTPYGRRLMV